MREQPTVVSHSDDGRLTGTTICRYVLMERLGGGQVHEVYAAEQPDLDQRRVALKLIRRGEETRDRTARFYAGCQSHALMDHPHVVRLFEMGNQAGQAFCTMELVRGLPITEYCAKHRFTPEARLQLFVSVCRAVEHVHRKGIIHRDLKPSHLLVANQDQGPVPKLIDFNCAKAVDTNIRPRFLSIDCSEMPLIGTPEYMSPEQASTRGLNVDCRTDVYSLGAILYELLVGVPPRVIEHVDSRSDDAVVRLICADDTPKPSVRISELNRLGQLALSRRDWKRTMRWLRTDLDWIIMKALAPDRTHRYESVAAFAIDCERCLRYEPVRARPTSFVYRLVKRLHRGLLVQRSTGMMNQH